MAINNTLQNTYSSLLKPNAKAANPFANPVQSALSSKIGQPAQPTWQSTLATVQKNSPAIQPQSSTPANPARPNQTMSMIPNQAPKAKGLVAPPVQNNSIATPSGAMVNPQTGGLLSAPLQTSAPLRTDNPQNTVPVQQNQPPTYPGLVSNLANSANNNTSPTLQKLIASIQDTSAVDQKNSELESLRNEYAQKVGDVKQTPLDMALGTGRLNALAGVFSQQEAAKQQALSNTITARGQNISGLSSGLSSELTGRGQSLNALGTAAGLAQGVQVPYSNQYIDPLTGKPVNGGSTGGSLNEAVQNVVGKLTRGEMTYSDAVSALGGYGQGGVNALQQSLPPGFNIAQSNTLAGQQGSITPALNYANLALNHAKEVLGNLSVPGQTSNIGIVSDVANWFSNKSGIGKEATRTKEGALAEARSAIQSVLASVKGGNPTEYRDQSYALLPNNATPADIDAAMSNLQTLGIGKQNIYSNPGQSGGNSSGIITTPSGLQINPNF